MTNVIVYEGERECELGRNKKMHIGGDFGTEKKGHITLETSCCMYVDAVRACAETHLKEFV